MKKWLLVAYNKIIKQIQENNYSEKEKLKMQLKDKRTADVNNNGSNSIPGRCQA